MESQTPASSVQSIQNEIQNDQPSAPASPRKWLTISGVVLVVILALGVGVLGYQNFKAGQQTPTPTPTAASELPPAPPPVPGEPATDETANWETYTNTEYRYSLKYPETLTVISEGFLISGTKIAAGIAIKQKQDDYDKPQLKIYIVDPVNPSTPDKFSSLQELADINYKKNVDNKNTLIKSVKAPYETTFNGEQAYGFTIESKGFNLAWTGFLGERGIIKAIIFEHNNKYFLIGYYDTPEFNQILSTFKFTE